MLPPYSDALDPASPDVSTALHNGLVQPFWMVGDTVGIPH
jgi:hypothetical protein